MADPTDPGKLSAVNQIVVHLSALLSDLLNAARETTDTAKLLRLNSEYGGVQACLFQATQAQTAQDEAMFQRVAGALRGQAQALAKLAAQIDTVVADAALAGRIAGYANQVAALAATL